MSVHKQGAFIYGSVFITRYLQLPTTKQFPMTSAKISNHSSDGVGRSGVACTVMTAIERLQFEGVIDIFQTVCVARHQRNGFIRNEVSKDVWNQTD